MQVGAKLAVIAAMIMLLMLPLMGVRSLVSERMYRAAEVRMDIANAIPALDPTSDGQLRGICLALGLGDTRGLDAMVLKANDITLQPQPGRRRSGVARQVIAAARRSRFP